MTWKRWIVPLAGVPLIVLLGYGLTRDARIIPSPLPGRMAPDFALETLSGDTLRLADMGGQVVTLTFWASWCLPCVDEHPLFVDADKRFRDDGLRVVGVVYQDTRANAIRWMRDLGGDWPNVLDKGSGAAIEYGVSGVPETFFIGRDGRVAYKQIGPVNPDVLSTWLPRLLADSAELSAGPVEQLPAGGVNENVGLSTELASTGGTAARK